MPVVDIVEIGAGGGSIAWFDEAGGLSVGPQQRRCRPRAGVLPGRREVSRRSPTRISWRAVSIRITSWAERSRCRSIGREPRFGRIAEPLGVGVEDAALGVIRIANANMVNALKLVSVRRGYDPREFDMVAFGGGGSMHAATLASQMKIGRVVVPPAPAHFSAWGMLMTDLRADWVRTRVMRSDHLDAAQAERGLA